MYNNVHNILLAMNDERLKNNGKAIFYLGIFSLSHTRFFCFFFLIAFFSISVELRSWGLRVRGWGWGPAGFSIAGPRGKVRGGRPAQRRLRAPGRRGRRRGRRRAGGGGGRLGQAGAGATTAMWRRRREGQAEEPRAREGLAGAPRLGKQGGGGGAGAEEGGGRRLKMNSARKIHHRQIFIRW